MASDIPPVAYEWRGSFTNREVNGLHAEAFGTRVFDETEWNWQQLTQRHSLGWVKARRGEALAFYIDGCGFEPTGAGLMRLQA
ncbi:MAG TPA: hypothetical protein VMS99_13905 [Acidimicrobiia bacterium]|nr:hypothetical protein [Acidimicrobiia bacterium]